MGYQNTGGVLEEVRFEVWDDMGRTGQRGSLERCRSHFLSPRDVVGILGTKLLLEIFVAEVVINGLMAEIVLHLVRDEMSTIASHVLQ